MNGRRVGFAVAAAVAVTPLGAQQAARVVVCVPAVDAPVVGERLAAWYGEEVAVEATAAPAFDGPLPAEARLWLLWDEWTLQRAAAAGAQVLAVPFVEEIVCVAAPDALGATPPPTWESIALSPRLHDRLGLVAPEVDGGPWLAAMLQGLQRGEGVDTGFALWTTLDARAGGLCDSYAGMSDDLAAGRLAAAIGPRRWSGSARGDRLAVHPLPGRYGLGLAIAPMAGPRARRIADDLMAPERRNALAAAAGLTTVDSRDLPLTPDQARGWWQRFTANVRGRGREVERIADVLDVVFGIGFVVCAWLLYRALRRTSAP